MVFTRKMGIFCGYVSLQEGTNVVKYFGTFIILHYWDTIPTDYQSMCCNQKLVCQLLATLRYTKCILHIYIQCQSYFWKFPNPLNETGAPWQSHWNWPCRWFFVRSWRYFVLVDSWSTQPIWYFICEIVVQVDQIYPTFSWAKIRPNESEVPPP